MVNVYNNYLHLQSEAGRANGEVLEGLSQEQATGWAEWGEDGGAAGRGDGSSVAQPSCACFLPRRLASCFLQH